LGSPDPEDHLSRLWTGAASFCRQTGQLMLGTQQQAQVLELRAVFDCYDLGAEEEHQNSTRGKNN